MSHEKVVTALKNLIKVDLLTIPVEEFGVNVDWESDRSTIILCCAMVERFVLDVLLDAMPHANSDERARIFNFEGPCGSFSNRIRIAHALGLIDRQTKREIEILKEMRNAAAHCVAHISFETPAIRDGIAMLMPENYRAEIGGFSRLQMKNLIDRACTRLTVTVAKSKTTYTYEQAMAVARKAAG